MLIVFWEKAELSSNEEQPSRFSIKIEALLFLLVALTACFFRIYNIESMPPGIWLDEKFTVNNAIRIFEDAVRNPGDASNPWRSPFSCTPLIYAGWVETPNLYLYYVLGILKLFNFSYFGIKMFSVLPGIITVLLVYFLAREIEGPFAAFIAGMFCAVSRWHITISRWGWDAILMIMLQTLGYLLILKAVKTRKKQYFILTGLVFGLSMYTYVGSRLAILALFVFLGIKVFSRKKFLSEFWCSLTILGFMGLLIFAPLGKYYVDNPGAFTVRTKEITIQKDIMNARSLEPLFSNIRKHIFMFHYEGDANPRHNLPKKPMLNDFEAICFALGIGLCLFFWRKDGYLLSLLWFFICILGGILSIPFEAPQGYRTATVAPCAALIASFSIIQTIKILQYLSNNSKIVSILLIFIVIIALGFSGYKTFNDYFVEQNSSAEVWDGTFGSAETFVGNYIHKISQKEDLSIVVNPKYSSDISRLLNYKPLHKVNGSYAGGLTDQSFKSNKITVNMPMRFTEKDVLYVGELSEEYILARMYPNCDIRIHYAPTGLPIFISARITKEDIANSLGLKKNIIEKNNNIFIEWTGSIYTSFTKNSFLRCKSESPSKIWVNNELVFNSESNLLKELQISGNLIPVKIKIKGQSDSDAPILTLSYDRDGNTEKTFTREQFYAFTVESRGLLARYYDSSNWTGNVFMTRVEQSFNAEGSSKDLFSIAWSGELLIDKDGTYTLYTISDDGSLLYINNSLVVDNGGSHKAIMKSGKITLAKGRHKILMKYFQFSGGKHFAVYWKPPDKNEKELLPVENLYPEFETGYQNTF